MGRYVQRVMACQCDFFLKTAILSPLWHRCLYKRSRSFLYQDPWLIIMFSPMVSINGQVCSQSSGLSRVNLLLNNLFITLVASFHWLAFWESFLHQDTWLITISVQCCQTMGRYFQRVQACQDFIALMTSLPWSVSWVSAFALRCHDW